MGAVVKIGAGPLGADDANKEDLIGSGAKFKDTRYKALSYKLVRINNNFLRNFSINGRALLAHYYSMGSPHLIIAHRKNTRIICELMAYFAAITRETSSVHAMIPV